VEQLRSWNHLTDNHVAAGRSLYVAEPVRLAPGTHATRGRRSGKRGTAPSQHGKNAAGKSGATRAAGHASTPPKKAPKTSSRKHAH
jgi:membrane-bound lytic murein transglycosylase D